MKISKLGLLFLMADAILLAVLFKNPHYEKIIIIFNALPWVIFSVLQNQFSVHFYSLAWYKPVMIVVFLSYAYFLGFLISVAFRELGDTIHLHTKRH